MSKKKIAIIAAILVVAAIAAVVIFAVKGGSEATWIGRAKDGGVEMGVGGKVVKTFDYCEHMYWDYDEAQDIYVVFAGSDTGMVEYQVDLKGNVISEKKYESAAEFTHAVYALMREERSDVYEVTYKGNTVASFEGYYGEYAVYVGEESDEPEYIKVYLTNDTDYLAKTLNLDGSLISEETFESAEAYYEAAYEVLGLY